MSASPSQPPAAPGSPDNEPVLPTVPEDERDEAWGDRPDRGRRDDDWYHRERPPHHG